MEKTLYAILINSTNKVLIDKHTVYITDKEMEEFKSFEEYEKYVRTDIINEAEQLLHTIIVLDKNQAEQMIKDLLVKL